MDIKKADRATLKSYFKKHSIPTESNFAEFIDGALNQKDDGIVKQAGEPLSIAAAGDATGPQKVINFFGDLAEPNPDWMLQLNPHSDQGAKAGFSISDGQGASRLFIDKSTGNVGIGTISPNGKLDVFTGGDDGWNRFVVNTTNQWGDENKQYVTIGAGGTSGIMIHNPHVSWIAAENRASIRLGRSGGVASGAWWDIGTRSNNAFSILRDGSQLGLHIAENGDVGIGTDSPQAKLDINGGAFLGYETTISDFGVRLKSGFYQGAGTTTGDVPDTSSTGSHLVVALSNIPRRNNQLQIASTFSSNDKLYFRKIDAGGTDNPAWNEVATRGSNTFVGTQVINGAIRAENSDIYFTNTKHTHTGFSNTDGYASIENAKDYDALMILGRAGTDKGRKVRLWDYLQVNGDLEVTGSIAGGETLSGWVLGRGAWKSDNWLRLTTTKNNSVYHDLAINSLWSAGAKRFDLAEITPVNEDDCLEQGDVVVIDLAEGLRVTRSTKPGDTAVYGIVSSFEQAAMVIGGVGGPEAVKSEKDKAPIALVGRVMVKVSDENGPIAVGDLLTTSATPGHAMRCDDRTKYAGSIIGKALESLDVGKGTLTALVSMQ
jgi:hypothetical protein